MAWEDVLFQLAASEAGPGGGRKRPSCHVDSQRRRRQRCRARHADSYLRGSASDYYLSRTLAVAVDQGTIGKLPRVSRPLTEKQAADWKVERDAIRRRYRSRYGVCWSKPLAVSASIRVTIRTRCSCAGGPDSGDDAHPHVRGHERR